MVAIVMRSSLLENGEWLGLRGPLPVIGEHSMLNRCLLHANESKLLLTARRVCSLAYPQLFLRLESVLAADVSELRSPSVGGVVSRGHSELGDCCRCLARQRACASRSDGPLRATLKHLVLHSQIEVSNEARLSASPPRRARQTA